MPKTELLGTHLFWKPEAAGSSDSTHRPSFSASDEVGFVTRLSWDPGIMEREIMAPSPGRMERVDVLEYGRAPTFTATVSQTGLLQWQALMGSDALSSGNNQYNPGEGTTLRGWLQLQQYNEENTAKHTVAVWCRIKVSPVTFDPTAEPAFDVVGMVLFSTQNTGYFSALE